MKQRKDKYVEKDDLELLERMIEKYGLVQVLGSMSNICGDKAELIATVWQNTPLGKFWIQMAFWVAGLAHRINDARLQLPAGYSRH